MLHTHSIFLRFTTGYIPGFNSKYGLPFMQAVEAGAKEWHEAQIKLRAQRDAMRAHAERTDPRNLLSRTRTDNVDIEIDHGHDVTDKIFGIVTNFTSHQSNTLKYCIKLKNHRLP